MKLTWNAVMLAVLIFARPVFAHEFLDHAEPAVGSTVNKPPKEVRLWFTQELEPVSSTVRVFDARGIQVDRRDKRVDASDRTLIEVSLPPLVPGPYRVIWRAISVDAHATEGDFTFHVAP